MAATESRYNAVVNLSEKISDLLKQKHALNLSIKEAEGKLVLRRKNVEADKANILAKANTEQESLSAREKRDHETAMSRLHESFSTRSAELDRAMKALKQDTDRQEAEEKLRHNERLVVLSTWVADAQKRAEGVDRQVELEQLELDTKKANLQVQIESLEAQLANAQATMSYLVQISSQAPASTSPS